MAGDGNGCSPGLSQDAVVFHRVEKKRSRVLDWLTGSVHQRCEFAAFTVKSTPGFEIT